MLIVNNNGTSNVIVTLYEKCNNLVNPYFLWSVTRKGSNDNILWTNDDTSISPYYWNRFEITIATNSVGLTQGIIPLFEGEWIYNVYEMENQYDLNINNAIGLVETGIMIVGTTYSTIPVYTQNDNQTIPVYRGI